MDAVERQRREALTAAISACPGLEMEPARQLAI
jgi:hypothetical protein